ncbi:hypothetical protein DH2020_049647 [Rehmannia glutinosa]|uniref:Poor homologous synapsis 1 PH domain-containing protein n=1 Tax=Rehmannia glutinosa TaxID=99300 RepID=A0ABR0U214_REHGL
MAGLVLAISTNSSELENHAHSSEISAVIDQWQVQYSRFINYSSFTFRRTHPSLSPVAKNRLLRGTWMSSSAKLTYQKSSTGLVDAVISVSLRSRVLEEHYISKMHFSWPQVSCVSGFPARGSKAVFVSYKDDTQKFALRFSTNNETEKFMNLVKEILENGSPRLLLGPAYNSELESQAEVTSSDGPTQRAEVDWQWKTSVDSGTQLMPPSSELNAAQDSVSDERIGDHEAAGEMSVFPPSFTQLLKNCHPAVSEAKPTESGDDLKTQFMQYLEGTSFKELLATVEDVVSVLGEDIVL